MVIVEFLAEVVGQIIVEAVFNIPVLIYERVTGKKTRLINGYRTERKKFVKFSVAKKFILTWETNIEYLKSKMTDGLETMNEKLDVTDFQFSTMDHRIIIYPPTWISFYAFHFLVQWLTDHNIKTIGVVETARTAYTIYNDPDSENLIGQTNRGQKFFISLIEDYSKTQFLRINRNIKTNEEYNVLTIKRELANSR
jgi:hypothetical protein